MFKFVNQKVQFRSIQANILMYFSFVILFTVLVIGVVFYYTSSKAVEKNADDYTYEIVEQVSRNIEYYIGNMEDVSSILYYTPVINKYLSTSYEDEGTKLADEQEIMELFNSIMKLRNDIFSIFIFGNDGQVITNEKYYELNKNVDITQLDWYKAAMENDGHPVVSSSHVQNFLKGKYRWVVSLSQQINQFKTRESLGVLLIDLNYKAITDICSKINLGQKGYVFIVDASGNIVYHPQQQLIYTKLKSENIDRILKAADRSYTEMQNGEKRLITIKSLSGIGWKIVGVSYVDDLLLKKGEIRNSYIMLAFICLLIAMLISLTISYNISRPIKKLEGLMKRVENGDLDVQIDIKSNDEIGHLGGTFEIMMKRIKELLQEIKKNEASIRKSELKALQAQINPHFLYNTLDSIVWMAESRNDDKVILMTSALAKFFRISLSKGREVIKIREEIEHVKNYLIIQKIRYDKKLEYFIDVDEDILGYNILKLILQPLVENAIYHGIKNLPQGGWIKICGRRLENRILLQVKDNGIGIEQQKLDSILLSETDEGLKIGGVGIKNVHNRLQLYYGENYGLEFKSTVNEGTTVNIWLPAVNRDE